jgi:hypothetical protein
LLAAVGICFRSKAAEKGEVVRFGNHDSHSLLLDLRSVRYTSPLSPTTINYDGRAGAGLG